MSDYAPSYFNQVAIQVVLQGGGGLWASKFTLHTGDPGEDGSENEYPVHVGDAVNANATGYNPGSLELPTYTPAYNLWSTIHDDALSRYAVIASRRSMLYVRTVGGYGVGIDCPFCGNLHPDAISVTHVGFWRSAEFVGGAPIEGWSPWLTIILPGATATNMGLQLGYMFLAVIHEQNILDVDTIDPYPGTLIGYGSLSIVNKKRFLNKLCEGAKLSLSLHTDHPGPIGDDHEYVGNSDYGPYQRQTAVFDGDLFNETTARVNLLSSVVFAGQRGDEVMWLGFWDGGLFVGAVDLRDEHGDGPTFGSETCFLRILKEATYIRLDDYEETP